MWIVRVRLVALTSVVVLSVETPAARTQAESRLGIVHFRVSCSAAVGGRFQTAVALLHSFDYERAQQQFSDIAKADTHCAMAWWGQAMSLYHPLWFEPDNNALVRGHELIEAAQRIGAGTERERDYIHAVAVFFDQAHVAYDVRTANYADAMQQLMRRYPNDSEAAIFYSLALLSEKPPADAVLHNRLEAARILEPLSRSLPDHPGVLHYLIHAYEVPQLARRGLPAARRYAKLAPNVSHAAHMPSHIFTLLGMWKNAIDSNLDAEGVALREGGMLPLHFMEFLHYAYLQLDREDDAQHVVKAIRDGESGVMPAMRGHARRLEFELPVRRILEFRRWPDAETLDVPTGVSGSAQAFGYWTRAIGAAHQGHAESARADLARSEALDPPSSADDPKSLARQLEAEAWIAHAENRDEEAITKLRRASEVETSANTTAHDWMSAPAREVLGELLFEIGRPNEALAEYEGGLMLTADRFNGLYGAGWSAEQAGNLAKARHYYSRLVEQCRGGAGVDTRAELVHAKQFLASASVR